MASHDREHDARLELIDLLTTALERADALDLALVGIHLSHAAELLKERGRMRNDAS